MTSLDHWIQFYRLNIIDVWGSLLHAKYSFERELRPLARPRLQRELRAAPFVALLGLRIPSCILILLIGRQIWRLWVGDVVTIGLDQHRSFVFLWILDLVLAREHLAICFCFLFEGVHGSHWTILSRWRRWNLDELIFLLAWLIECLRSRAACWREQLRKSL